MNYSRSESYLQVHLPMQGTVYPLEARRLVLEWWLCYLWAEWFWKYFPTLNFLIWCRLFWRSCLRKKYCKVHVKNLAFFLLVIFAPFTVLSKGRIEGCSMVLEQVHGRLPTLNLLNCLLKHQHFFIWLPIPYPQPKMNEISRSHDLMEKFSWLGCGDRISDTCQ